MSVEAFNEACNRLLFQQRYKTTSVWDLGEPESEFDIPTGGPPTHPTLTRTRSSRRRRPNRYYPEPRRPRRPTQRQLPPPNVRPVNGPDNSQQNVLDWATPSNNAR